MTQPDDLHLFTTSILIRPCYSAALLLSGLGALFVLFTYELLSAYKDHTTLKGLVGISPSGAMTFISQLYKGSISDREIVERSGILDLPVNEGHYVMAHKGFTIIYYMCNEKLHSPLLFEGSKK